MQEVFGFDQAKVMKKLKKQDFDKNSDSKNDLQ